MKDPPKGDKCRAVSQTDLASLRYCTAGAHAFRNITSKLHCGAKRFDKTVAQGRSPKLNWRKKSEGVGILAFAQIPLPSKLSIRKFSISFESCPNRDCLALSHFGKNPLKSFFLNLVLLVFPDLINTLYAILIFMQVFFEKKLHLFSTYNLCFLGSAPNDFLKMVLLE